MQNYHPLRLLWKNIPRVRQYQFCLLLLLMILVSFAEIVSISAVVPFLGVLASPDTFLEGSYVKPFAEMMDISDSRELLFPLTIAFCLAALISGLMRFILSFREGLQSLFTNPVQAIYLLFLSCCVWLIKINDNY